MSSIKRFGGNETASFLAHVKALSMKTDDVKKFINSLNHKEQEEYKSDIAELKKRIWCRVILREKGN